jgi:curved DNA-binding protein CbpA
MVDRHYSTQSNLQPDRQLSYYLILGLHPSASPIAIRRAYRELSKQYHPDTTSLTPALATQKFQQLNEAYATLSHPERRLAYDYQIGYSRVIAIQTPQFIDSRAHKKDRSSSAYLDPTDRPLSSGEIFALFMMGVSLLGCLVLAVVIGKLRGEL